MFKFRMPRVQRTFCLFNVKSGTLFIAIFESVTGAIGLVFGSFTVSVFGGLLDVLPEDQHDLQKVIYGVSLALAITSAIQLIIALLLLSGTKRDDITLIVPWLVYSSLNATIVTVVAIINFVIYSMVNYLTLEILFASVAAIYLCLKSYFILVVYSMYKDLSEKKKADSLMYVKKDSENPTELKE